MQIDNTSNIEIKKIEMGDIVLGIATNIGPRILYLTNKEKPEINVFNVLPDIGEETPEGYWKIYGGHRLWRAPESKSISYSLDDKPIQVEQKNNHINIIGNPENKSAIQKEITIKSISRNQLQVKHKIKNLGPTPIHLACWALSVMKQKGIGIIPIKPSYRSGDLLPDRHFCLWPYSNLSDSRLKITNDFIYIHQDPTITTQFKLGTIPNPEWIAYYVDEVLFVKHLPHTINGKYPDFGSRVEVYVDNKILELETLGPIKRVNPSKTIQHTEIWSILPLENPNLNPYCFSEKLDHLITSSLTKAQ